MSDYYDRNPVVGLSDLFFVPSSFVRAQSAQIEEVCDVGSFEKGVLYAQALAIEGLRLAAYCHVIEEGVTRYFS